MIGTFKREIITVCILTHEPMESLPGNMMALRTLKQALLALAVLCCISSVNLCLTWTRRR